MANMLYNGLSLPDISTVWDKSTHPFATIEQSIVGGEVTGEYAVIFSAEKGSVGADGGDYEDTLVIPGAWVKYRYNPDLGFTEWTEQTDNETFDGDAEVATLDLAWANYDVPDGDGTTFLKASDPLDPEAELVKGQIYKYNGVELAKTPEVTTDYPYLYIVAVKEAYESATTFKYALFASTHRAVYDPDADNVVIPTTEAEGGYYHKVRGYEVAHDDDRFVWNSFTRDDGTDVSLTYDGVCEVLWANTDILNSSTGAVYFAATKAVKVGGLHMPSYWAGFAFGMVTPEFASKIGMWSYNGVVLPALPSWDKATYSYAFIRALDPATATDYHELFVFKTKPTWFKVSLSSFYGVADGNTYLKAVDYPTGSDEDWGYVTLSEKTSGGYLSKNNFENIIWANFDVLNEDGSGYLAASDPVPV